MIDVFNQTNLFGLNVYLDELISLYENKKLPKKIIFSGPKGLGKSTLALHLINCILSKDEEFPYDIKNNKINTLNKSYKLVLNKSSPNFYLIDVQKDKKNIEINQIRNLINFCNKSSFNDKPRFILIDDIEFMNLNSSNALLKLLEEPNSNIYLILINNSNKVLSTIKSRCLEFKISLSKNECIEIFNKIINQDIEKLINKNLLSYYFTTGDLLHLYNFSVDNEIDLKNITLKDLLIKIIDDNYYKKENLNLNLIYSFVQMYFITNFKSQKNFLNYSNFIESVGNIKRFNLDIESLFIQFRHQITND